MTQYVNLQERAWHAGKSMYEGREACNDFSVGVELEGADTSPYEAAQYEALAKVVAALCAAYPRLSPDRLVGHSDIAPGRKTDPGPAFDWPRARGLIAAACALQGRVSPIPELQADVNPVTFCRLIYAPNNQKISPAKPTLSAGGCKQTSDREGY